MATQADLTRLNAILKDRPLQDELFTAINRATPMLERTTQQLTLSGRKGIWPASFGVNEGVFARADKGTFGDSQVDQPELADVKAKYLYALFEISGPTMSATRDSVGAFEEALTLQLEKTLDGVKLDLARQILNRSAGMICTVQSRTDGDTVVMHNPYGLTYKTNRPVRNVLRPNMSIDIRAPDDTVKVTNSAISAVTHGATGTTVDFSPAETTATAAGDEVFRSGNKNNEIDGFFTAEQTSGTYLGISRAGRPGWQGVVVDAAAGGSSTVGLDPDMLQDTLDQIAETTGHQPNYIVTNFKQRRNIYNLLAPQIRFTPTALPGAAMISGEGVEPGLSWNGVPVLVERFFPPEHIGFWNSRFYYHVIDKEPEWIPGEAGVLHFKQTADLYVAVLRQYRNFVCLYPATSGYLFGLDE